MQRNGGKRILPGLQIGAVVVGIGLVLIACRATALAEPGHERRAHWSERPELAIAPSVALEFFVAGAYRRHWAHRAIAVGPAGVFASTFRERSYASAGQEALKKCREKLRWHKVVAVRRVPCVVYAIGDKIVFHRPQVRARSHSAIRWLVAPGRATKRGLVVHVSDCGARRREVWHETWFDYLSASGFSVALVEPPKFARQPVWVRSGRLPRIDCPLTAWMHDAVVRDLRDRLLWVVARLQEDYPDHRIVVWADGIGADAVHATRLNGVRVITTGNACGFAASGRTRLGDDVRIDSFFATGHTRLDLVARRAGAADVSSHCAQAGATRPMYRTYAMDGSEALALWRNDVMGRLATVLGTPAIALTPGEDDELNILPFEAYIAFNRTYRLFSWHRAFILSANGEHFFGAGEATPLDAVQAGLYHCNRAASGNGFVARAGRACIVFARGEQVVFREPIVPTGAGAVVE